jgi:hypothetical protein
VKFQATVANHQGITFAIAVVEPDIIDSQTESTEALRFLAKPFPGLPILLMARDPQRRPRYRGPADIVSLAATLELSKLAWREYSVG